METSNLTNAQLREEFNLACHAGDKAIAAAIEAELDRRENAVTQKLTPASQDFSPGKIFIHMGEKNVSYEILSSYRVQQLGYVREMIVYLRITSRGAAKGKCFAHEFMDIVNFGH